MQMIVGPPWDIKWLEMLFAAEKWKDQKTKAKTNKTNQTKPRWKNLGAGCFE